MAAAFLPLVFIQRIREKVLLCAAAVSAGNGIQTGLNVASDIIDSGIQTAINTAEVIGNGIQTGVNAAVDFGKNT